MSPTPTDATSSTINKPTTTFLDLPLKIRTRIYHLALHADNPIPVDYDPHQNRLHPIPKNEEKPPDIPNPSLLRTCHKVHDEATPIFYGKNKIHAPYDLRTLHELAEAIGESKRHIRHLSTGDSLSNETLLKATTSRLKESQGLEKLQFEYSAWTTMPAANAAEQCSELVQTLHEDRCARSDSEDVTNVVEVVAPKAVLGDRRDWMGKWYRKEAQEYTEELRGELRKRLE